MDDPHHVTYRYKEGQYHCSCGKVFANSIPGKETLDAHMNEEVVKNYVPADPLFVGYLHKKRVSHEYWVYDVYHPDYPLKNPESYWWLWGSRFRAMVRNSKSWDFVHSANTLEEAKAGAVMALTKQRAKDADIELASDMDPAAMPAQRMTLVDMIIELLEDAKKASTVKRQAEVIREIDDVLDKTSLLEDAKARLVGKIEL